MPRSGVFLAHQGGWDEILMVAGPILVIVVVLWIVKRRVDRNFLDGDGTETSD